MKNISSQYQTRTELVGVGGLLTVSEADDETKRALLKRRRSSDRGWAAPSETLPALVQPSV